MADMLKITSLVNPKNYTSPVRPLAQSDSVFNIVDLTKIVKPNDRSSEFRQTDNSSANQKNVAEFGLNISKSPSFTTDLLKGLLSKDFISQIYDSDSPDIIKEFNEFSKNIFLPGDKILSDMVSQQKGLTAFNGELFDVLRNLSSQTTSPELKGAITQFLKNAFSLHSQNSVMKSLSTNFIYLSQALYPSRSLSQSLEKLGLLFLGNNAVSDFPNLKSQALTLLSSVENSLIATDDINNLVSLIKYNLSRFSGNTVAFEKSFDSLLNIINDSSLKESLKAMLSDYIQSDSIPEISKMALTADTEISSQIDMITRDLAKLAREGAKDIIPDKLSESLDNVTQQLIKVIDNQGKHPVVSLADANDLLAEMLSLVLPQSADEKTKKLLENFSHTKNLNALVNRLSFILNSIDDYDTKSSISNVMNELLTALSNSDDIIYRQPTSMDYLSSFLSKCINNENIAHLGIVDPDTLVHSLLSAPGVYTPLLHFVLPVQIGDIKAFGEAWIYNPTTDKGVPNTENINHIFLNFDIQSIGSFELEMFTYKNTIDINLFCPNNLDSFFAKISSKFFKIANNAGFSVKSAKILPLKKIRNLAEVFPVVSERRVGLNVKI